MTDQSSPEQTLKDEIAELSIQLVQAKYLVEEALIRQEWARKVRQLIKERRGAHAKNSAIQNPE